MYKPVTTGVPTIFVYPMHSGIATAASVTPAITSAVIDWFHRAGRDSRNRFGCGTVCVESPVGSVVIVFTGCLHPRLGLLRAVSMSALLIKHLLLWTVCKALAPHSSPIREAVFPPVRVRGVGACARAIERTLLVIIA